MQQRVEADDSLDDFPTPSWGTRAFVENVLRRRLQLDPAALTALEPACNRGYMARPLAECFANVWTSDVHDYGYVGMDSVQDFLFPGFTPRGEVDLTICNPPFRLAQQFIAQGLAVSRLGCAMLVRTAFLEGGDRYQELFSVRPPTVIAQFAERIILTKGIVRDPSKQYWDEKEKKWKRPSTATSYCWIVWMKDRPPQPFAWIPPCRRQMERPGDYPELTLPEGTNHTSKDSAD